MVDVYLLALVEQGKARINLKKGTPIERTNLGDIEFKPETLRSFESVELPRALDDWAIFSPFLEVMAGVANETFGPKYEQMTAHEALSKLREVWVPSEKIDGLISRVSALFRELGQSDPYDALLLFWMGLFQQELSGENDQEVFDGFKAILLNGLGERLAYGGKG